MMNILEETYKWSNIEKKRKGYIFEEKKLLKLIFLNNTKKNSFPQRIIELTKGRGDIGKKCTST